VTCSPDEKLAKALALIIQGVSTSQTAQRVNTGIRVVRRRTVLEVQLLEADEIDYLLPA
jgi:hypothetical protein